MKRSVVLALFLLTAGAPAASAQQAAALSETQRHGQQLFAQSCGICHLPPERGARTYGPALNKNAGGGDDDVMRQYITEGTPRMPSFKAYLKSADIDAIISYVRTVPAPAAAPAQ
jgi:mono/diheme cytochrome c family protein